jgi:hypothetical protein
MDLAAMADASMLLVGTEMRREGTEETTEDLGQPTVRIRDPIRDFRIAHADNLPVVETEETPQGATDAMTEDLVLQ